jgi:uracil phosphoribosyltransferase
MRTLVIDHPLVTHKLTALRDAASDTATFRSLTDELVTLLAYEATREIRVQPVSVTTPVGTASGVKLGRPVPLIVPVLRAGTLATVISMLVNRGAASVTAVCLLAAPEGLRHVEAAFAADEVRVVTAAVDEKLNDKGYIVPGLGDAGDRLFGRI